MAPLKTGHFQEPVGWGLLSIGLKPNDRRASTCLYRMHVRDVFIPEAEAGACHTRFLFLGGKILKWPGCAKSTQVRAFRRL